MKSNSKKLEKKPIPCRYRNPEGRPLPWPIPGCGTSAFLPFWYRMEQLLSTHNLLKHRLLRIPFYFCMSFGSYVLVPPAWFILLYFMDQQATKEALVAKMGLYESYKEILFDNRTLAVDISFDGCSQGGLVSIFRCCLMGSVIYVTVLLFVAILGCSTVSFILLQKERSTMSEKTKKIHRQFLISLLAQVRRQLGGIERKSWIFDQILKKLTQKWGFYSIFMV